jgi:hypothetical protein
MAIAALAGVPRDRVLNYRTAEDVVAWARALRDDPAHQRRPRP